MTERASFQAYVDIFEHDNTTVNAEPNPETSQSKELHENGWFLVPETDSEADPALASVTKQSSEQSSCDLGSPDECKLRKDGAAKAGTLCGYLNKCKVRRHRSLCPVFSRVFKVI